MLLSVERPPRPNLAVNPDDLKPGFKIVGAAIPCRLPLQPGHEELHFHLSRWHPRVPWFRFGVPDTAREPNTPLSRNMP